VFFERFSNFEQRYIFSFIQNSIVSKNTTKTIKICSRRYKIQNTQTDLTIFYKNAAILFDNMKKNTEI
jgi:hypothetical protein